MKMNGLLSQLRKKSLLMLVGVSTVFLPAVRAEAQANTHDGFFLQMDLGIGGMTSKVDSGSNDAEASGGAGEFSIAIGGAVSNSLIIAGQAWAVAADKPDLKVNGRDIGTSDATFTLSGFGLNVIYYFPSNVYLSATPSWTTLKVE
jgi:hypothetical protein